MKRFLVCIIVVFVSLFFVLSGVNAKDKAAHKPHVLKECKKDGTKCTPEELKDKKMKKECKNPCPPSSEAPPPVPPPGDPPAPPAGK